MAVALKNKGVFWQTLATQKQIAEQFQVHRNTVSAALQTYRRGDGVKKTPQTKAKSWTAIDEETGRRLGELLAQGRSIRSAAKACRVNHGLCPI